MAEPWPSLCIHANSGHRQLSTRCTQLKRVWSCSFRWASGRVPPPPRPIFFMTCIQYSLSRPVLLAAAKQRKANYSSGTLPPSRLPCSSSLFLSPVALTVPKRLQLAAATRAHWGPRSPSRDSFRFFERTLSRSRPPQSVTVATLNGLRRTLPCLAFAEDEGQGEDGGGAAGALIQLPKSLAVRGRIPGPVPVGQSAPRRSSRARNVPSFFFFSLRGRYERGCTPEKVSRPRARMVYANDDGPASLPSSAVHPDAGA